LQTKIRVGAVSYLNTKPLIYGFEKGLMSDRLELVIDFPSKIASLLLEDQIDIGLVPVAIIPELKESYIISDYCISCDGAVASVCLFSDVPLPDISTILLDYQSRTSVELLKILKDQFWKIDAVLETTTGEYQSRITGTTAALVIGDRALEQRSKSPYCYDLGLEWKKHCGLPFVFAAWVANKKLDPVFIQSFNEANLLGLNNLESIVKENPFGKFDLYEYYTKYISFRFSDQKREALRVFLDELGAGSLPVGKVVVPKI
jgi:chorismate dehydratase